MTISKKSNPPPSSPAAENRMKASKQRDTTPEKTLRSNLFRKGLRYRIHKKPIMELNRVADILFPSIKIAIFVDGCFWHGCPIHGTQAKANAQFWKEKIERNKERDIDTTKQLENAGWTVIRIWEHEDLGKVSEEIYKLVHKKRIR
jgi:DNA mismatch endonuclease (patch repair protein)